jgi:hypothetical protein
VVAEAVAAGSPASRPPLAEAEAAADRAETREAHWPPLFVQTRCLSRSALAAQAAEQVDPVVLAGFHTWRLRRSPQLRMCWLYLALLRLLAHWLVLPEAAALEALGLQYPR